MLTSWNHSPAPRVHGVLHRLRPFDHCVDLRLVIRIACSFCHYRWLHIICYKGCSSCTSETQESCNPLTELLALVLSSQPESNNHQICLNLGATTRTITSIQIHYHPLPVFCFLFFACSLFCLQQHRSSNVHQDPQPTMIL